MACVCIDAVLCVQACVDRRLHAVGVHAGHERALLTNSRIANSTTDIDM